MQEDADARHLWAQRMGPKLRERLGIVADWELQEAFGLKGRTLMDWRTKGVGPAYIKIGRSVYYRVSDVLAFIDAQCVSTNAFEALEQVYEA